MICKKQMFAKFVVMLLVLLLSASLTACSSIESTLENRILEKSGILDSEDYKKYKQMEEDNELEKGHYIVPVIDEAPTDEINEELGSIHVTFATNRYLKVEYYLDMDLTNEIDQENCYLNPGDSIYAKAVSSNPNTNLYEIEEYRVVDYSNNGQKEIGRSLSTEGLVYQVPSTFLGTEIGIVPVGKYQDRTISVQVSLIDDNGESATLSNAGTLFVNDTKYPGTNATINPLSPYILKYEFDKKNYFFVRSIPECFTEDPNAEGVIEFFEVDPTEMDFDYSIQLHKYISLNIKLDANGTICVNDGDPEPIKKDRTWPGKNLKFGDVLVVESSGVCTFDGNARTYQVQKDSILDGFRYTITIVNDGAKNNEEYITVLLDAEGKYGDCIYKLDGKEVSGPITAQQDQKLKLTYKITKDGYKFKESNVFDYMQDLVGSMTKTVDIPLSPDLNNSTIHPDDWIEIIKK